MRRLLIIEDDKDANDVLADLGRNWEFEPVQCLTGEEGLRQARQCEPELILLDLMLPDLDGYKVCEELKLDRKTNPIPIVMVTALSAAENRVEGFRVGADAYISKPYTPGEIERAIGAALAHRERLLQGRIEHFLEFHLSSEVTYLQDVNEMVGMMLQYTDMSEREVRQLRSALQEMGMNAIEWGNRNDTTKLVKITCHVGTDEITVHVEDEGEGFDPRNLPHAAAPEADDPTRHMAVREILGLREGGFGILITRGLVDEVVYNETGNRVTLTKRIGNHKS